MKTMSLCLGLVGLCIFIAFASPDDEATAAASPSSSPGARLEISILSILGKPVPRGEVVIFSFPENEEEISPCGGMEEPTRVAFTSGAYSQELPAGQYRVEIASDSWQGAVEEKVVLPPGGVKKIEFRLKPGFVIAGRVTDAGGAPISGATIKYWSPSMMDTSVLLFSSQEAVADSDGRFRLANLREGAYRIVASHPTHVEEKLEDIPTGSESLSIVLKQGCTIRGQLTGETAKLGPKVRIELKTDQGRSLRREVSPGAEGDFVISDLEKGAYSLRVAQKEYISEWAKDIQALAAEDATPVILKVFQGGSVSGRVIDARHNLPLKGAFVALKKDRGAQTHSTDDAGVYRFEGVAAGRYEIQAEVTRAGLMPELTLAVEIAPGQNLTGLDFRLDPGEEVTLSGLVTDESGLPLPGAAIRASIRNPEEKEKFWSGDISQKAKTDDTGMFSMTIFTPARVAVTLVAKKDGFAEAASDELLVDPEQKTAEGIHIILTNGATVSVEVSDEDGEPVPGAVVELMRDWSRIRGVSALSYLSKQALTDGAGVCQFQGLPIMSYLASAKKSGYPKVKEKIEVKEGETQKRIRLVLRKGRSVRVSVKDGAGSPIAGVGVDVVPEAGSLSFRVAFDKRRETDASGTVVIADLPAAPIALRLGKAGYLSQRLTADQDEVEAVLLRGGSVTGRVLSLDGKPGEEVRADIVRRSKVHSAYKNYTDIGHSSRDLENGMFKLEGLIPGTYDLYIRARGLAQKMIADLEIKPAETLELGEVRLAPGGTVTGKMVKKGTGSPLSDVMVWVKGLQIPGARSRASGVFTIDSLPAGSYTLLFIAKGYRSQELRDVSIVGGQKRELPPVEMEEMTPEEKKSEKDRRDRVAAWGISWESSGPSTIGDRTVGAVEPGSAAEKAGILPGDKVVRINGKASDESPGGWLEGLYAKPGTKVAITVKRHDSGREESLELTTQDWEPDKFFKDSD